MSKVASTDLPEVEFRKLVQKEFAQLNAKCAQLNAKYAQVNAKYAELNAKCAELHQKIITSEAAQAASTRLSQPAASARSSPWGSPPPRMSDFPEFSPTGNEQKDHQTVRKFLLCMRAGCERYGLTDESQWVQLAMERMKGKATRWSSQQLEDFWRWSQNELSQNETKYYAYFENWSEFCEVVVRRFEDVQAEARAREFLRTIEQGKRSVVRSG